MEIVYPNNKMNYPEKTLKKFWARVDYPKDWESNSHLLKLCWDWKGPFDSYGRPIFRLDGKYVLAKVVMYESFNGPKDEDKKILFNCKNKKCVNQNHLFQSYSFYEVTIARNKIIDSNGRRKKVKITIKENDMLKAFNGIKTGRAKTVSDIGRFLNIYDSDVIDYLMNDNWMRINEYYSKAELGELRKSVIPIEYRKETSAEIDQFCKTHELCFECLELSPKHIMSTTLCEECFIEKYDSPGSNSYTLFNIDSPNPVRTRFGRYLAARSRFSKIPYRLSF